jgi:hypothetical protein
MAAGVDDPEVVELEFFEGDGQTPKLFLVAPLRLGISTRLSTTSTTASTKHRRGLGALSPAGGGLPHFIYASARPDGLGSGSRCLRLKVPQAHSWIRSSSARVAQGLPRMSAEKTSFR